MQLHVNVNISYWIFAIKYFDPVLLVGDVLIIGDY